MRGCMLRSSGGLLLGAFGGLLCNRMLGSDEGSDAGSAGGLVK